MFPPVCGKSGFQLPRTQDSAFFAEFRAETMVSDTQIAQTAGALPDGLVVGGSN